ncbi:hypothetical protein OFC87_35955, partial [Escherichia coli]|nr:hypothetical protein [Escherichia coli]
SVTVIPLFISLSMTEISVKLFQHTADGLILRRNHNISRIALYFLLGITYHENSRFPPFISVPTIYLNQAFQRAWM